MADGKLYFAYGSNINLEQMAYRCPDASVVGPVTLEGWELLFRRGGFATIAPKEGEQVTGLCQRHLKMSFSAEIECHFSPGSIQVYTALITGPLVGLKPVKS